MAIIAPMLEWQIAYFQSFFSQDSLSSFTVQWLIWPKASHTEKMGEGAHFHIVVLCHADLLPQLADWRAQSATVPHIPVLTASIASIKSINSKSIAYFMLSGGRSGGGDTPEEELTDSWKLDDSDRPAARFYTEMVLLLPPLLSSAALTTQPIRDSHWSWSLSLGAP